MSILDKLRAKKAMQAGGTGVPGVFPGLKRNDVSEEDVLITFGYSDYRPGQKEMIDEVIVGTTGVLAVMATGYGKSALFQIPALMTSHLTVVISPLISLMKDQVDALVELGVAATFINSTQTPKQQTEIQSDLLADKYQILYVSPERFKDEQFVGLLRSMRIGLFVIDEAHCFIADTIVSTPYGGRHIDSLNIGDEVISRVDGEPRICRIKSMTVHRGQDIWKVNVSGRDTYCDGGQKFFVKGIGFVDVGKLHCGHEIIYEVQNSVPRVWHGEDGSPSEGETTEQVLFGGLSKDWVWEDEERGGSRESLSGVREEVLHQAGVQDGALLAAVRSAFGEEGYGGINKNDAQQSNERPNYERKHVSRYEGNRQAKGQKRRQRSRTIEGGIVSSECRKLQTQSHCKDWSLPGREWVSDALQAGFGVAIGDGDSGGGRSISQVIEGAEGRQAKGIIFETARVESVSRVERGGTLPTGECLGENPVGVRLYDIEVEGSNNFFANGVLVHNCISSWGHDFRPSYAKLGDVIKKVTPEQVLAVTATATEKVKEDICDVLDLPNAKVYVRGIVRENLEICIFDDTGMIRQEAIADTINEYGNTSTGIVYVATKKEADILGSYLQRKGIKAMSYHAGLKDSIRKEIQEDWANNGGVVVATSAFGMGIDRADVRFVIHSGFTDSIEAWYQEIGRAGRDGLPSTALSLYNMSDDYGIQTFLIDLTTPDGADIKAFWKWMKNYAMGIARPNAKTTTINMTQKEMGGLSKCSSVGAAISFLKGCGLVETKGRGKYQVSLEKKDIDFNTIAEKRKKNLKKFYALVEFYKSKTCRFGTICEYFGDDSFNGKCGNCDNCEN